MTKKILGLDIGTTSIGWAIVEATDVKSINSQAESDINNDRIGIYKGAVGVRIISQDTEQFDRGKKMNDVKAGTLTPTANRRKYRGARRMKNRYKIRRDKLHTVLELLEMKPDGSFVNDGEKNRWNDEHKNSSWYTKEKEYYINEKGNKQRKKGLKGI